MNGMDNKRLQRQLRFIQEMDRLKTVVRQTLLIDGSRQENAAEHSWHSGLMAVLLSEYMDAPDIDLLRTVTMLLIHDVVEIDAGDTFCYDEKAVGDQKQRESKAADRIFGMLPQGQSAHFRRIWDEFDRADTPEARFAHCIDRVQPLLHNYLTRGIQWRRHGVKKAQVMKRMQPIEETAPLLWEHVKGLIEDAVDKGYLFP
jgi:putative hydrolase of HD superfamily